MKLVFLGTRGYVEPRNRRHRRHTALLASYRGQRVMVDAGEDWSDRIDSVRPHAIVLTHAHPDHAGGLAEGVDCQVFATPETWERIHAFPIRRRHRLHASRRTRIRGIVFTPFRVEHSTRCPTVGYQIRAGAVTIAYVPDVAYIPDGAEALKGVDLYVGDGATMRTPMIRRRGEHLIGHASVRTQLTWCSHAGISAAVITHCGAGIVTGDERRLRAQLRRWAGERGVTAQIAYDGMEVILR
jgi:phosphoribosyl 1,2-cyclic phosphodiesterase